MARAGRKRSTEAKRRQTSRAGQGRAAVDQGTPELRERKLRATRRADLPIEPLGVLYGHGKIDESEYRAGLRLEQARRAFLGADTAAERQVYGDRLTRGSADQWAARQAAANGSGEAGQDRLRREARIEAEYDQLLATLHACSRAVAAATLGIATRPYAGAWLATALVEGNRNWGGRHQARLALIREGLQAIDRLGSRPL